MTKILSNHFQIAFSEMRLTWPHGIGKHVCQCPFISPGQLQQCLAERWKIAKISSSVIFHKKPQAITKPHLRMSRVKRCTIIFIRYWKIQKSLWIPQLYKNFNLKGIRIYFIALTSSLIFSQRWCPISSGIKNLSIFMMISALHPVSLPMKKYPASIQTERLMDIFWLDSTCALTDHLTSIKIIEKHFFVFCQSVSEHAYLCLYLLSNCHLLQDLPSSIKLDWN